MININVIDSFFNSINKFFLPSEEPMAVELFIKFLMDKKPAVKKETILRDFKDRLQKEYMAY